MLSHEASAKAARRIEAGEALAQGDRDSCTPAVRGSMTVEAAIAVPLCLFFILNLIFVMEVVRLQCGLQAALQQAGEQICETAYYTRFGGQDQTPAEGNEPLSFVLSETYVRGRVVSYLGKSYLDHTCIKGGAAGLSFSACRIMTESDRVDLIVNYRVKPFVRVLSPPEFSMQARFCGHAWVGWTPGSGAYGDGAGSADQNRVYVTKYGEVYHTDPECIYLNPQIRAVPGSEVDKYRSGNGARYYPCEHCRPDRNGTVYITKEGNRYHSSTSCSDLTRYVREIDSETAQKRLRPCPKCGHAH